MRTRRKFDLSVTTTWTEEEIQVPASCSITRVKAYVDSPGTEIAIQVRETTGATDVLSIPLEYALVTSPLDSVEDIFVQPFKTTGSAMNGNLYIAVKADASCDAHVVIEVES